MLQQQRIERLQDIVSAHSGAHRHRQRLPRELMQNSEHLVTSAIAELVVDEVPSRQIALPSPDGQTMAQTWLGCVGLDRMIELSL